VGDLTDHLPSGHDKHFANWKDPPCYQWVNPLSTGPFSMSQTVKLSEGIRGSGSGGAADTRNVCTVGKNFATLVMCNLQWLKWVITLYYTSKCQCLKCVITVVDISHL